MRINGLLQSLKRWTLWGAVWAFHAWFVNPLYLMAQSNEASVGTAIQNGVREDSTFTSMRSAGRPITIKSVTPIQFQFYGTPFGTSSHVTDAKPDGWLMPQFGFSVFKSSPNRPRFSGAPQQGRYVVDNIAAGSKLTKADAARNMRPRWGLNLQASSYAFTPHHLLDGYENKVSTFTVTEVSRKNWNLLFLSLSPVFQLESDAIDIAFQAGPSLVQTQAPAFRQGDTGRQALYQDYHVPNDFKKWRIGAEGNVRIQWRPLKSFPLGLFLQGGYNWQPSYSFLVRERDISKVNFNLSPDEIRFQLSNAQLAPFVEKSYSIPHGFFQGHIGLSIVFRPTNKTTRPQTSRMQQGKPGKSGRGVEQAIVFRPTNKTTRPQTSRMQQPQPEFRIVLDQPRPRAVFRSAEQIPAFRWHVVGEAPPNGQYLIEIFQLNDRGEISSQIASSVLRQDQPYRLPTEAFSKMRESQRIRYYQWKITETNTGTSSPYATFSVQGASCGTVTDSIQITCDGWDVKTGLPKYTVKICLTNHPTQSTSGCNVDYTSIASSSGGSISGLSPAFSLSSPLTISPNGTACFTFTYIPASLSQSTASFTVSGNWQDQLGNTANLLTGDSLKSCVCHACDSLDIQLSTPQVQMQSADPHLFTITGTVTATPLPVYALEFSIASFSYTAKPGGCTTGVDSIEHSGVIVGTGTTVNGSSSNLVFGNASFGNPNVFKLLKWMSSPSPIPPNTPIPYQLVLGLPAPLAGLDPSCCQIEYTVCLQVRVFYDSCKSCVKTICFSFHN